MPPTFNGDAEHRMLLLVARIGGREECDIRTAIARVREEYPARMPIFALRELYIAATNGEHSSVFPVYTGNHSN